MKNQTSSCAAILILLAVSATQSLAQSIYEPYTFITLAGLAGHYGSADGTGSAVQFYYPDGVAVDSAGNVYVADLMNNTIRKVTPAGVVTTLAGTAGNTGSADGTRNAAQFSVPSSVAVDSAGNVYVADTGNSAIRKVTPTGVVTTLAGLAGVQGSADGTGSAAQFSDPQGVAVDSAGNVYVADAGNYTIRKITPDGAVSTLAGLAGAQGSADGTRSAARFFRPEFVAVDSAGNIYVSDSGNHTIRKITPDGAVSTLAGLAGAQGSADGTGSAARFGSADGGPSGVAVDSAGNVYVADWGNNTIRKVTPAGVVTTLAGLVGTQGSTDGTGSAAWFGSADGGPSGVAVDSAGNVYVSDWGNFTIKKGLPAIGLPMALIEPQSQSVATTYNVIFTVFANGSQPMAYQWLKDGAKVSNATNASYSISNVRSIDAGAYSVALSNPSGIVTSSNAVLTVTLPYTFTTLAGLAQLDTNGYPISGSADGTGSAAQFNNPSGVAVDGAGNVYLADQFNCTIRKVTAAGVVTTLAGTAGSYGSSDGTGSVARFGAWEGGGGPAGVAVDSAGNVYVADYYNFTIRKVTPSGVVTTLAGMAGNPGSADGTGSAARFGALRILNMIPDYAGPAGVAVDSASNVYVADSGNNTIRKVTAGGVVTTLAGSPQHDQNGIPVGGSADGTGSAAQFNNPSGVAVDGAGNVYVADSGNNTIRKVTPGGVVSTLAGKAIPSLGYGPIGGYADGTGSAAQFSMPQGIAVDGAGNVYVADTGNSAIREVTPTGVVTTLGGLAGNPGSADGTGSAARFGAVSYLYIGPSAVAVDGAGNLYVADSGNNTIRKGYPAPMVLTSGPGFGFNGGHFGFNLTGPAGQPVVVEASTDLVNWLPIWTNTFAGGPLSFSDPQSDASSHRFYRTRTP